MASKTKNSVVNETEQAPELSEVQAPNDAPVVASDSVDASDDETTEEFGDGSHPDDATDDAAPVASTDAPSGEPVKQKRKRNVNGQRGITIKLTPELHKKLRHLAIDTDSTITQVTERLSSELQKRIGELIDEASAKNTKVA